MACPLFLADYAGFCRASESLYVPSIDELEHFCFTGIFGSCRLFRKSMKETTTAQVKPAELKINGSLSLIPDTGLRS